MIKMMKVFFVCTMFWVSSVSATPFSNIDPTTFGSDVDGNGYFSHNGAVTIGVEAYDAFDTDSNQRFEFGFYFEGASGTLISIFDTLEPTGATSLVDFTNGAVVDLDDGLVEGFFTPTTADYGFYLSLFDINGSAPIITAFSDPMLNGGDDLFGAFDLLTTDVPAGTLAGMFFSASPENNGDLLYVAPLITISVVSEPYSLFLMGLGLTLLVSVKRQRRRFS